MKNHSEGPWIKEREFDDMGDPLDVWSIVVAGHGGVICADISVEDDADLIARAPTLYALAARTCSSCLYHTGFSDRCRQHHDAPCENFGHICGAWRRQS